MKNFSWISVTLSITLLMLSGCGGAGVKVNTGKLQAPFQSAPADTKNEITKAASAIQTGNFPAAVTAFKTVAKKGGLSQEQKDAIAGAVAEMQMIASQDPNKYSVEVYRSIGEVMPLLEGQPPVVGKPAAAPQK